MAKKKQEYNPNYNNLELFDDELFESNVDSFDIENIDTDTMNDDAIEMAKDLVNNFQKLYYDEDFMERNPNLKKRIECTLESLRICIKMRKANEIAHDKAIRGIGQEPTNASLYNALSKATKSVLDVQDKIDRTLKEFNDMLKNVQMELNFKSENSQNVNEIEEKQNTLSICRGNKDFINKLKENNESEE